MVVPLSCKIGNSLQDTWEGISCIQYLQTPPQNLCMWCLHSHQASSASRAEQSSGDNKSPSLFPHGGSNFWHFVAPTWPCNCSKRLHRRINSSYILAITRCQLLRKQRIHIYEEGFNVTSNLEGRCIITANLLSLLNRLISSAIMRDAISKTQIKDVVSKGGWSYSFTTTRNIKW